MPAALNAGPNSFWFADALSRCSPEPSALTVYTSLCVWSPAGASWVNAMRPSAPGNVASAAGAPTSGVSAAASIRLAIRAGLITVRSYARALRYGCSRWEGAGRQLLGCSWPRSRPSRRSSRRPSASVKPGSIGDQCGVFPRPGPEVPADAPSLPDQRAWNQNISQAPLDPNSDAIIKGLPGDLHPDFGSPRAYGIPYKVVGKNAKRVKVKFTAYGNESDHGKYRIPLNAGVEGGSNSDGDRHVIAYDKKRCKLYELYRGFSSKKKWKADGGAIWDLRSPGLRHEGWTSADAAGLPIFPGLVRYDEVAAGPPRPRDPPHLREHPQRLDQPGVALRRRHLLARRAGDGYSGCGSAPTTTCPASPAAPR